MSLQRISAVIAFALLSSVAAYTQTLTWEKTYGTNTSAHEVQQTSDAGFIIIGSEESATPHIYLVKTDGSGNKSWERTFGDPNDYPSGASVQQMPDGSYIVGGGIGSLPAIMKVSATGDSVWAKRYGIDYGSVTSLVRTSDGGIVAVAYVYVGGGTTSDLYLFKVDASGTVQWEKKYGGANNDGGNAVRQTSDGGFIVAGWSGVPGSSDVYLLKTDAGGNKEWDKTFAGIHSTHDGDEAVDVRQTGDGGYIVAGRRATADVSFETDLYLLKTDGSGVKQWEKTFGGSGFDGGNSVRQTSDGGYIVTGFEGANASFDGLKVYLLKVNADGFRESDLKPRDGYGHSLVVLTDGSIIVAGGSNDQAYLAKLGSGVQPPDNKRYTYYFGTSPMFEFAAPIDWQGKGAGKIGVDNQTITINGMLKFTGTIELDTTRAGATDNIRFTASGRFFLADAPLPGSGRGELTLFNGTISSARIGSPGIELISVGQGEAGVRLFGTDLHVTRFQSIGGVAATGFRMAGWFDIPEVTSCRNPADERVAFTDLEIDRNDIKLAYIEALSYGPIFCMDQPSATYDRGSDALVINGWMRSNTMFPEQIRALTGISGGHLLATLLAPGNNPEVKFGSAYIPPVIRDFTGAMAFFNVPLFDMILGPFTSIMGTVVAPGGVYEADIPQGMLVYAGAAPKGQVSDLRMLKLGDNFYHIAGTPDLTLSSGGLFVISMFEGAMKAGRRNNGSYVIDGEGHLNVLQAGTGAGVNGTITGTFTMPMRSPDLFTEAMGTFIYRLSAGQTLANHTVTIKGSSVEPKMLYTTVPSALPFADPVPIKINLSKKESEPGFFNTVIDMQKVLRKTARKSDDRSAQSAADRLDTFQTDDRMEQVYFRIWSQGSIAGTYLISPSGERIEATKGDSSIIHKSASGQEEFWGLYRPAPGKWQIGIQNASASDSVMVAVFNMRRPFDLSASQQGRDVTASWNAEGAGSGSTVSLYLDTDTSGLDGMLIGQVSESAGTFSYTLSDTLSECSYYLHAIRDDNSRLDADYAPQSLDNAKSGLAAPGGITALYSQSNNGVVMTWSRSGDPAVVGYLVRVTDADGSDSIYAMPYAHQTTTAFIVENVAGKTVSMASYDSLGHRGCWSPEQLMVPASVRDAMTGAGARLTMNVIPNPAHEDTRVSFTLHKRGNVHLTLFDNLGRTVSSVASGTFDAGEHQMTIDVSHLPTGTYSLLLQAGDEIGSQKIVVVR